MKRIPVERGCFVRPDNLRRFHVCTFISLRKRKKREREREREEKAMTRFSLSSVLERKEKRRRERERERKMEKRGKVHLLCTMEQQPAKKKLKHISSSRTGVILRRVKMRISYSDITVGEIFRWNFRWIHKSSSFNRWYLIDPLLCIRRIITILVKGGSSMKKSDKTSSLERENWTGNPLFA